MSGRSLTVSVLAVAGAWVALSVRLPATQVPQFRTDTSTVSVSVTVKDKDGRLVRGLTPDDFIVEDNGKAQKITVFETNSQPVTTIALVDRSQSTNPSYPLVQRALDQFFARMLPADKARFGTFSYATIIEPEHFTHDRGELMGFVRLMPPQDGPSPVYTTVDKAITLLKPETGRRVLLLFTDGYDQVLRNTKMVEFYTLVERARAADVMVYSVGLEFFIKTRRGRIIEKDPETGLPYLSRQTGGGYIELTKETDIVTAMEHVQDELHSQYAIGFVPAKLDGKRHRLWVRMKREELRPNFRQSYVATPANLTKP